MVAARSDDFTMPLSIHVQYMPTARGIPKPTSCERPTLRDVAVADKIVVRHYDDEALKLDVYHLHNPRTNEWLTTALGKDPRGNIGHMFMEKGRIMTSEEDLAQYVALNICF